MRDLAARRAAGPLALAAGHEVRVDRGQHEIGDEAAEEDERRPAEGLRPAACDVESLERRVDREESEQPDRQGDQHPYRALADTADERQPEHAERDRDDADVEAEQGHQPVEAEVGARASRRRSGSRGRSRRRSR